MVVNNVVAASLRFRSVSEENIDKDFQLVDLYSNNLVIRYLFVCVISIDCDGEMALFLMLY